MPYKDPEAAKAARKRYYEANRERLRQRHREWVAANRDRHYANIKAWHEANRERATEIKRASEKRVGYRPKKPEVVKAAVARWRKKYPERAQAYVTARRARKIQRTPPWFGELDELVAREAHHLTRLRGAATGFSWHVDHVVPLSGACVSGLHVWNNLTVIPAKVNRRKSNQFEVT